MTAKLEGWFWALEAVVRLALLAPLSLEVEILFKQLGSLKAIPGLVAR